MSNQPSPLSLWQTLKNGQHYAKTWPCEKQLNGLLPENRVIRATRFATHSSIAFTLLIIVWHLHFHTELLPTLLSVAFALSLPLQGLWWLGKRSSTLLPQTLLFWYLELRNNLLLSKLTLPQKHQTLYMPTYQDLAELLKFALKNSPQDFWDAL